METKINKSKLLCIQYPAVVEDDKKMLDTIGGLSGLSSVYEDPMKRLELKWRPGDNFCKPVYGDRFSAHKLLLRVRRKKSVESGDHECGVQSAEIVGIAEITYKFECLADFQYVAADRTAQNTYESFYDKIVLDHKLTERLPWLGKEDAPLFMGAPLYSRMDRPQDYSYKDRPKERTERRLHIRNQPDTAIIVDRASRKRFSQFMSFHKPNVPANAPHEAEQRMCKRPGYRFDVHKRTQIEEAFAQRPLWSRTALECYTQSTKDQLKFILPLVAYFWETGPWRTFWCRFGFDPRKEPSAKIYQLVDFRVRGAKFERINVKRSYSKEINLPTATMRSSIQAQPATMMHQHLQCAPKTDKSIDKSKQQEILWKFRADELPTQRQTFYHLCDIEVDDVQKIVHANDGKEAQCTERDGWLEPGYADKVRTIMTGVVEKKLELINPKAKYREIMIDTKKERELKEQKQKRRTPKSQSDSDDDEIDRPADDTLDSDEYSSGDDGGSVAGDDEIGASQRTLRTRTALQKSGMASLLGDGEEEGEEEEGGEEENEERKRMEEEMDLEDSDLDPDFDPLAKENR